MAKLAKLAAALVGREPVTARDPGLAEIDAWERWHVAAQLEVLATQGHTPEALAREQAAARTLSAVVAERMRSDYLLNQRRAHAE